MSSNKKILFIVDRNKQVLASKGPRGLSSDSTYFVIDYVGEVDSITRDAYYLNNGALEKNPLQFVVLEHLKTKHDILKVDKRRRDARSKSQNSLFSVVSLKEVVNGN